MNALLTWLVSYLRDCPRQPWGPEESMGLLPRHFAFFSAKGLFLPIEYIWTIKRRKAIPVVFISHKEKGLLHVLEVHGGIYPLHIPREAKIINSSRRTLHLEASRYPVVGA